MCQVPRIGEVERKKGRLHPLSNSGTHLYDYSADLNPLLRRAPGQDGVQHYFLNRKKSPVASLLKLLRCNNNNLSSYRQSWFHSGLLGASKSTRFLEKVPRLSKGRRSCRADSGSVNGVDTAFFSHAQTLTPAPLRSMTRWNLEGCPRLQLAAGRTCWSSVGPRILDCKDLSRLLAVLTRERREA